MANIVRKWESVIAVGCTHGNLIHPDFEAAVHLYVENENPTHRIALGDHYDTTSLRTGAISGGEKDVACPLDDDIKCGQRFLTAFRPTVYCLGNHEHRAYELAGHYKAPYSKLAKQVITEMTQPAVDCGAHIIPWTIFDWYQLGGFKWGHGHFFGRHYLARSADSFGNCVVAHAHSPGVSKGLRIESAVAYGVGTGADIMKLTYAHRRPNTLTWGHSVVVGHVSGDKAALRNVIWGMGEKEWEIN